eukprot:331610-Pyramimonas_sp.AAC.1
MGCPVADWCWSTCNPVRSRAPSNARTPAPSIQPPCRARACPGSSFKGPVSYTHLRAHETGAYL